MVDKMVVNDMTLGQLGSRRDAEHLSAHHRRPGRFDDPPGEVAREALCVCEVRGEGGR